MQSRPKGAKREDLFRVRLVEIIDLCHELVKLVALIDWEFFEYEWTGFFPSKPGGPASVERQEQVNRAI